jgi:hypothetical protein
MLLAQAPPPPSPTQIFLRAQQAWLARAVPPYESFRIACDKTFLAPRCEAGEVVQFTVRMRDGRSFAESLPAGGVPSKVLARGAFITGPAGTPLGFYRLLPGASPPPAAPPNLVADPLQTIATVTADARVYDVALAGDESLGGRRCYHLVLRPYRDASRYPLRDLWVEEATDQIVQLAYERPYVERDTWARVLYRFAPVGPDRIWAIVHIEAEATLPGFLSHAVDRVSDDLEAIAFPQTVPDAQFEPGAPIKQ